MERAKRTIICYRPVDKSPVHIPGCVYSPLIYSMGPGTKTARYPGALQMGKPALPGIDISRFHGGTPINSVSTRLDYLSGELGAVLIGGRYGKIIANSVSFPVYVPEEPANSTDFAMSIAEIACPIIHPVCYFVDYINGKRHFKSFSPIETKVILQKLISKCFCAKSNLYMYTSIQIDGGFRFVVFDTLETVANKCALTASLGKTPIVFNSELNHLVRQNGQLT